MRQLKKIYVIAPSSLPKNKAWLKGIKILQSWGFEVLFDPKSLGKDFFHAHNHSKRLEFLKQAFLKASSKDIIWMLRGGYGFQKLMPEFAHYKIKNYPLFVGYSDGTAMHLFLNQLKQKTLHAPTVSELPDLSLAELNQLQSILLGTKKSVSFDQLKSFKNYPKKTLSGKITGGNLSLLSSSLGTCDFPASSFLFIEEINEPAYKVDRMLHHLLYAGRLKSLKAILLGDLYPVNKKALYEIEKGFAKVCSIPLFFNLPCGHKNKKALPLNTASKLVIEGSKARLELKIK